MKFVGALLFLLLLPISAFSQSFEEVKKKAENGDRFSQSFLASMYEEGRAGAPQDHEKAAEWYLRAAEDGNPEHLSWVGRIYDKGIGVPKDFREAYRWYLEAAIKGYSPAAYSLGYLIGKTKQDKVETLKWIMVSQGLNNDPAFGKNLGQTVTKIKSRMAKAEVSAATAEAKKWLEWRSQQLAISEPQKRVATEKTTSNLPVETSNDNAIAVIIGNKTYDGSIPEVSFAHNDADAFRKFVIEGLGYREGNIIDLRDATFNQMITVFGNDKTHEGKLFDYIRPGESDVTVFYSGHGVPGLKDRQAYLLPRDGDPNRAEISGYPIATLYKNLIKLPARTIRVFIDACFSGETPKGMLVRSASGISVTPKVPKGSSRLVILTAAQGDQLASWDEDAKHGLFTKHLLEALHGAADGEKYGDGNGNVTLAEVGTYLKREMTYQARRRFGRVQEASLSGMGSSILTTGISKLSLVASEVNAPKKIEPPQSQSASKPSVSVYPVGREPGAVFKDCDYCPVMVVVPRGTFQMGSNDGYEDDDDKPRHKVDFNYTFAVGKFEISQAEWAAVMDSNPSYYKGENKPVDKISWFAAQDYLGNLNAKLKLVGLSDRYRLLTESEWEYVARAGTTSKYFFGNSVPPVQNRPETIETFDVGSFPSNDFGLHDVHGNVWEWVEDCWSDSYQSAPSNGSAWKVAKCFKRVSRGGPTSSAPKLSRSAGRSWDNSMVGHSGQGFRIARTLQ
jgi:formylglycine-generating enzyme required for sulfatase activity